MYLILLVWKVNCQKMEAPSELECTDEDASPVNIGKHFVESHIQIPHDGSTPRSYVYTLL